MFSFSFFFFVFLINTSTGTSASTSIQCNTWKHATENDENAYNPHTNNIDTDTAYNIICTEYAVWSATEPVFVTTFEWTGDGNEQKMRKLKSTEEDNKMRNKWKRNEKQVNRSMWSVECSFWAQVCVQRTRLWIWEKLLTNQKKKKTIFKIYNIQQFDRCSCFWLC